MRLGWQICGLEGKVKAWRVGKLQDQRDDLKPGGLIRCKYSRSAILRADSRSGGHITGCAKKSVLGLLLKNHTCYRSYELKFESEYLSWSY